MIEWKRDDERTAESKEAALAAIVAAARDKGATEIVAVCPKCTAKNYQGVDFPGAKAYMQCGACPYNRLTKWEIVPPRDFADDPPNRIVAIDRTMGQLTLNDRTVVDLPRVGDACQYSLGDLYEAQRDDDEAPRLEWKADREFDDMHTAESGAYLLHAFSNGDWSVCFRFTQFAKSFGEDDGAHDLESAKRAAEKALHEHRKGQAAVVTEVDRERGSVTVSSKVVEGLKTAEAKGDIVTFKNPEDADRFEVQGLAAWLPEMADAVWMVRDGKVVGGIKNIAPDPDPLRTALMKLDCVESVSDMMRDGGLGDARSVLLVPGMTVKDVARALPESMSLERAFYEPCFYLSRLYEKNGEEMVQSVRCHLIEQSVDPRDEPLCCPWVGEEVADDA